MQHDLTGMSAIQDRLHQAAPRRLRTRYAFALGLVLSLLVATFVLKEVEITAGIRASETVQMAGHQRLLTQRILFMTLEPLPRTPDDWEDLSDLLQNLSFAHHLLTNDPALPPEVRDLYFQRSDRPNLDRLTRDFVSAGRALLGGGDSAAKRDALRAIGLYRLVDAQDAAVVAFEREAYRQKVVLERWQLAMLIGAFATVLVEVLVIFWPALKLTSAALHQVEAQRSRIAEDARRLQSSLKTSEQLRQEQGEFTYALSHELKSPGNTLSMLLEELQALPEVSLQPEAAELVQMGQATVGRMGQLIESVLAYTQTIDSDMTSSWVDLDALLAEVEADLAGDLRDSRAVLVAQPLGSLIGNSVQLWVLLQNLVGNAVKFRALDRTPQITISATRDDVQRRTTLRVTDNGIGIPPEHRKRVFGLFKRLHAAADYPGSGMGLTLCAHVAHKHGGSIAIEDGPAPGVGCSVVVVLHDTDWSQPAEAPMIRWGAAA